MKKISLLLMLALSITGTVIAQDEPVRNKTDIIFDQPSSYFKRKFIFDLGKGNTMQVEFHTINDLARIANLDSLLQLFLKDIIALKDSLTDDLVARRIDYLPDPSGKNKMRVQSFKSQGSSYLAQQGTLSSLKIQQDTLYIIGSIADQPGGNAKFLPAPHYYRIGFCVNQLSDLNNYPGTRLNNKISGIHPKDYNWWSKEPNGRYHIKYDGQDIYANQPGGYTSGAGDYIEINGAAGIQNYKNYFAPSLKLGVDLFVSNGNYKTQLGIAWEPHFLFAKNNTGALQTYRNDFITLTLGRKPIAGREKSDGFHFSVFQQVSVGYLVAQKGGFLDTHTFRLGTSSMEWGNGRLKLEPVIYFHDLFKSVSPGLRLSVNF